MSFFPLPTAITKEMVRQHGIHAVDFKGEAITFKATTAGIVATMSHCIDLMSQREEQWRRKLEREQTARKRLEEKCKHLVSSKFFTAGFFYVSKIIQGFLKQRYLKVWKIKAFKLK